MITEFVNFVVSIVEHMRRAGLPAVAGNYRVSPELSREELRREVLGILGQTIQALASLDKEFAMSVTVSFYQEQVDACAAAEAEANLPMLREKFRRAGAAWEVLASTARRTEAARAKREAESRERVAAAAEAAEVMAEQA